MQEKKTLLAQGAEGKVFRRTVNDRVEIVKQRFRKSYRHPDLDAVLVVKRTRIEARNLNRCSELGIRTPKVYSVDAKNGLLVMEDLDKAITAKEWINTIATSEKEKLDWFVKELGQTLAKLHLGKLIHGDLTTSNIMLEEDTTDGSLRLVLIDFGLSFVATSPEARAVDLYVMERAFESTHPDSGKWNALIIKAYAQHGGKDLEPVLVRLEKVRARGRKKICIG